MATRVTIVSNHEVHALAVVQRPGQQGRERVRFNLQPQRVDLRIQDRMLPIQSVTLNSFSALCTIAKRQRLHLVGQLLLADQKLGQHVAPRLQ